MRRIVLRARGAGLVFCLLACVFPAGASAFAEPLDSTNYSTETVCGPPAEDSASCFADGLVPVSPTAQDHVFPIGMYLAEGPFEATPSEGVYGLRPEDLHNVYELPQNAPNKQTIAIVEAYDAPTIEHDLRIYDEEFGLPPCTFGNGCFRKMNQNGAPFPLPSVDAHWAADTSLDVETAHAICENCDIILVEAATNSFSDLEPAVEAAVAVGATEIVNPYGAVTNYESSSYNNAGVVLTVAAGDAGYSNWEEPGLGLGSNFPASSANVVAVGGTSLSPFLGSWAGEEAWSHTGSGCSTLSPAQLWQATLTASECAGRRAVADVSADADPYSGVAIYDSTPLLPWFPGWATFGGTSLSATIVAAEFALAGGSHGVEYPAKALYAHRGESSLHDITSGTNYPGGCGGASICQANVGWDGPTGVGTPRGVAALRLFPGTEPTVTGVSPAGGRAMGGLTVEITGTELVGATAVHFGEEEGRILDRGETSMTVETPEHGPGAVDVTVTGSGGNVSKVSPADRYEYSALTPVVERVSPSVGPPAGGTLVTIEGTGLAETQVVAFGAPYYGNPISVNENRVTVLSPRHPEMTVELRLISKFHGTSLSEPYVPVLYTYASPEYDKLTIHMAGSGQGTVTIAPTGGTCSSDCVQGFEDGTPLTLGATPRSGSTFTGWSGACSGSAFCHFTTTGNAEVTATFEAPLATGGQTSPSTGTQATKKSSASSETLHLPEAKAGALKDCLAAAHKAYHHAVRVAHAADQGRAAALRKAKKDEYRAVVSCRRRY